jgi:hypothetical protein
MLLFRDAVQLNARQVHRYVYGVYSSTVYDNRWIDATGLRRYQLLNRASEHFAAAAAAAWSAHYLARTDAARTAEGEARNAAAQAKAK